jgi:hypothetical protein
MRTCLIAVSFAAVVYGGSVELSSGDLSGGSKALDNIKAKWSQSLNVLGNKANLEAEYDRGVNENFLSEATLTGSSGKINYEAKTDFGGSNLDVTLSTKTDDGSSVEVEGTVDLLSASDLSVTKVSATKSASLRGVGDIASGDYDIELSHNLKDNESKIKMSTVIGSGIKAIGTMTRKGADHSTAYEVEYDTTLTDGRTLHANVNPQDGSGEIEYVDTSSLDGTLTATIPVGGQPKVTFKRSFGF